MAKQSQKAEHLYSTANKVQSKKAFKTETLDLQSGASENHKEESTAEQALLDLTRSAIGNCLDDFAEELPADKKDWVDSIKKALNDHILEKEDKKNSLDAKFTLFRIEIACKASQKALTDNAKKANPVEHITESQKKTNKEKPKKKEKYRPFNLSQVLLKRTLV